MTKMKMAALAAAVALVACGGGGGGGGGNTEGPGTNPPAPAPAIPTVEKMTAPNYTAADCPRFLDTKKAEAALDRSNENIRTVADYLQEVDPEHAYPIFVRRPADFVNWIASQGGELGLSEVGIATHETQHQVDLFMYDCGPGKAGHKVLLAGAIYDTMIVRGATPSIKTVADAVDGDLPKDVYFKTYITDAGANNDLRILLDEFAAYAGAASTQRRALDAGKAEAEPELSGITGNLEGAVHFMVYLQAYLKAWRVADPAGYDAFVGNNGARTTIQAIWSAAERELVRSFKYTADDAVPRLTLSTAFLKAAYSPEGLAELDRLRVSHDDLATWTRTYLK